MGSHGEPIFRQSHVGKMGTGDCYSRKFWHKSPHIGAFNVTHWNGGSLLLDKPKSWYETSTSSFSLLKWTISGIPYFQTDPTTITSSWNIIYISHCKPMMVCKISYHGLSTPIRQMVSLSHYKLINCLYYGLLVGSYSSLTINQSVNSLKVYNPSWTRDSFNIGSNHCFTATRLQALSSRHWSSQKPSAFLRRAAAATRSVACFDPKIPTDFPIKTGDLGYPGNLLHSYWTWTI